MTKYSFILVTPQFPGNIGFTARVIKNFGFTHLILIDPCEMKEQTYKFAVRAANVVKNAPIYDSLDQAIQKEDLNYLIGTTARIGGKKNPKRNAVPSDKLRSYPFPSKARIGIVFGPEQAGLENSEVRKCDLVATIPTSETYPSLNLSHSVGCIAYELSLREEKGRTLPYEPSKKKERDVLIHYWRKLIETLYHNRPRGKIEIYHEIMENLAGRSFLTRRETHSLIGITKRILQSIASSNEKNELKDQ